MAKDIEQKERFIELRAMGRSLEKCSKELKVSTTSLVQWSKDFSLDITNLREIQLEALREQFMLSKQERLKAFGELLQRITEEIKNRDLKDVETAKLMELFLKVHSSIGGELSELTLECEKSAFDLVDFNEKKREKWAA